MENRKIGLVVVFDGLEDTGLELANRIRVFLKIFVVYIQADRRRAGFKVEYRPIEVSPPNLFTLLHYLQLYDNTYKYSVHVLLLLYGII